MTAAIITFTAHGFCIQGHVSFDNVIALRHKGENYIATASSDVIEIDLAEMKDADASSFTLFLCLMRYAKKRKRLLKITHASPSFMRMQKMFGLEFI